MSGTNIVFTSSDFGQDAEVTIVKTSGTITEGSVRGTDAVVTINGQVEVSVVFPTDPIRPAILRLDRPYSIRNLDIRLVERIPGSGRSSRVGLAEIGLFIER